MSIGNPSRDLKDRYNRDNPLEKKPKFFTVAPDISKMPSYTLIDHLYEKGMEPWISTPAFEKAHDEANYWEYLLFRKGYEELAKVYDPLPKGELLGSNDAAGKLYVSRVVPQKHRQEICYHEWVENMVRKKLRDSK